MTNCENCMHYEIIKNEASSYCLCSNAFNIKERQRHNSTFKCEHFKDKSRYIELPYKVGDMVYCIDYILKITEKCKVYGFKVFADGKIKLLVDNGECKFVTSNWYNTQEEAENKLKEIKDD